MKRSTLRRSLSVLLCVSPVAFLSAMGCGGGNDGPPSGGPLGGAGGASPDPGDGGSSSGDNGSGGRSTGDMGGATGSGGTGAECQGTECTCPDGTYWDAVAEGCSKPSVCAPGEGQFASECFSCSPAIFCDGEGETGNILAITGEDGASCICETEEGYFPGSEGSIAEPCDVDGDGWTTDRAQPSVESDNTVVRANARCDVRRIRSIFLENEDGHVYDVSVEDPDESLTVTFPGKDGVAPGLPLYESSRNDADPGKELPLYQANGDGRRLTAQEVNGFTKACIGSATDLNHNGVSDVAEWEGADFGRTFSSTALESYYRKYAEFSYFVALYDGFWEAIGQSGIYRIVERRRSSSGSSSAVYEVPLEYPASVPNHAYECSRHPDSAFWLGGEVQLPTIGGDFVRFAGASMLHHSQYKCIEIVSPNSYTGSTSASAPHRAYIDDGKVFRKVGATKTEETWSFNECWAESSSPSQIEKNALLPQIECRVQTSLPQDGDVRWAAVHYEHYEDGYDSLEDPGGYVRGCANACADSNAATKECWGCGEDTWGEPLPLGTDTACGEDGKESCDGEGHCSGCIAGQRECKNAVEQWVCSEDREWTDNVSCQYGCYSVTGKCYPDCAPGTVQCSAAGVPQKCSAAGQWVNESACGEMTVCKNGGCVNVDGLPCESDDDCGSGQCTAFFPDKDGDGFGAGAAKTIKACGSNPPSGGSKTNNDCCDKDKTTYPGQTDYAFEANECGSYDYNCDKTAEKAYTHQHACNCTGSNPGWIYGYPDCGESGTYGTCHQTSGTDCHPIAPATMKQACR